MSWLAHPEGILAMASLIVVHGFKPVFSGLDEWVGDGNGGRASPGLRNEVVSMQQRGPASKSPHSLLSEMKEETLGPILTTKR